MTDNKTQIPAKYLKRMKIAYKKLYLKSKEIYPELSYEQQDAILGKLVDEMIMKLINKQVQERSLSEEDIPKTFKILKDYIRICKTDLKLNRSK